jgi:hypothetical protein
MKLDCVEGNAEMLIQFLLLHPKLSHFLCFCSGKDELIFWRGRWLLLRWGKGVGSSFRGSVSIT